MAILQEAQKIQAADPIADMEKAWQQGDRRFAVVSGVGAYMPGVNQEKTAALGNQYGVKVICAPGDSNWTDEKGQLKAAGFKYGTVYNHLLLSRLGLTENIANGN